MGDRAGLVGAAALMAALIRARWRPAGAAETVAPVPKHEAARIGQERGVLAGENGPDLAQLGEGSEAAEIGRLRSAEAKLEREHRLIARDPEQRPIAFLEGGGNLRGP